MFVTAMGVDSGVRPGIDDRLDDAHVPGGPGIDLGHAGAFDGRHLRPVAGSDDPWRRRRIEDQPGHRDVEGGRDRDQGIERRHRLVVLDL